MNRQSSDLEFITSEGLDVQATLDPSSPVLDEFFSEYDRAFVLANEKEPIEGFRECLQLNGSDRSGALAKRFQPFAEVVLTARLAQGGPLVGGANFIAFAIPRSDVTGLRQLTINLNYIFISPEHRRGGLLAKLFRAVEPAARRFLAVSGPTPGLIFIEQNDPVKMSAEDYRRDTEYTGLDQIDRIGIWARLGARVVDHPYVQPPLSDGHHSDDSLVLSVLGARSDTLNSCVLLAHLKGFFGISVLKGRDIDATPTAARQVANLTDSCQSKMEIRLLDPISWLASDAMAVRRGAPSRYGDLRSAILNSIAR